MDIKEFNFMDGMAKTQVLATDGVYLAERNDGSFRISLYQLSDFYVEISYHKTRCFYICIRSFQRSRRALFPTCRILTFQKFIK